MTQTLKTLEIPDAWLMGACTHMTLREAIAWWQAQERLQELWEQQHQPEPKP